MLEIAVSETVGPLCITRQSGKALYDLVHPELIAGRPVRLDFAGVTICAAPFMNAAVGQLFKDLPAEDIKRLLIVENLCKTGRSLLPLVMRGAEEYWAATPEQRRAIDQAVIEALSES